MKGTVTLFHCPACNAQLHFQQGSQMCEADGVTVYCPSRSCPAQEVSGHAGNVQAAFKVIQQKYEMREMQQGIE